MEILRFYYWLYWSERLGSLLHSRRSYIWAGYVLGWLFVAAGMWWWGRQLAAHSFGNYTAVQSVWLYFELALLATPILVCVGALLYTYQTFFHTPANTYSLPMPADRWNCYATFLFLVFVPVVPMWLVALPALVGLWSTGVSLGVWLGYLALTVGWGIFVALCGIFWFLLLQYGVYHSGIHAALRVRLLRILLIFSVLMIVLGGWVWLGHSFFAAPPFGPVGGGGAFGGGVGFYLLSWLSDLSLVGYALTALYLVTLAAGYGVYRFYAYFWRRRYELIVSFRESAVRATGRIGTRVWFPFRGRATAVVLQIELLQWLRNTARVLWLSTLWVLWLCVSILVGFGLQQAGNHYWLSREGVSVTILTLIGLLVLVMIVLRCGLPYILPNTPGGYFLRTLPIARGYTLQIQVCLLSGLLALTAVIWLVSMFVSGHFSGVWLFSTAVLYVLFAITLSLVAAILRLRTDYQGLPAFYTVLTHTYGRMFVTVACVAAALLTILVTLAVVTEWWWIPLVGAVFMLGAANHQYYQVEYQYRTSGSKIQNDRRLHHF